MQNHTHIVDPVMLEEQARQLSNASRCGQSAASITERAYRRELVFQFGCDLSMIKYALYAVTRRTRDLYHDISRLDDALVGIADAAREADGRAAMKIDTGRDGRTPDNPFLPPALGWILRLIISHFRKYFTTDSAHVKPLLPPLVIRPDSSGKNSASSASTSDQTTSGGSSPASSSGENSRHGASVSNTTGSVPSTDASDVQPNPGYTKQIPVSENLKRYAEDGKYSDFHVVSNFSREYCQEQKWKNNCTTTAEAIAYSIKHQRWTSQFDMTWINGAGAKWDHSIQIESGTWTETQKMSKMYELLSGGTPVILNCVETYNNNIGHTVTVIGIRDGADPNNLTYADFLIVDPADGAVKTLQEMNNSRHVIIDDNSGWNLKIPK